MMYVIFLTILIVNLAFGFDSSKYNKTEELSKDFTIYWNINNDEIELALKAKTTGWLGFGLAERTSGSMPGADIITGSVSDEGIVEIQDRFALGKFYPDIDDCQNWELISGEQFDSETVLEIKRKLDTGDSQDREIIAGNTRVVYAFSDSNDDAFGYHDVNRKATSVYFIGEKIDPLAFSHKEKFPEIVVNFFQIEELKNDPNVQTFDFTVDYATGGNFSVPVTKTTYYDTTTEPFGHLFPDDGHIVAFEIILCCDEEVVETVHHLVIGGCFDEACTEVTTYWAWAPGVEPLVLPKEAGFRIGNSSHAATRLSINTHYDNPKLLSGLSDNSGIRVYFTLEKRQYDAGVLSLGDVAISQKDNIPQGNGEAHYEYNCDGRCTEGFPFDINVFGSFHHLHQIGSQLFSTVWRDGQFVFETNRVDFYDFNFQQVTPIDLVIKPGDRINTHCSYWERPDRSTQFQDASDDEMCLEWIFYYPFFGKAYGACGFLEIDNFDDLSFCPTVNGSVLIDNSTGQLDFVPNPSIKDPVEFLEKKFGKKPSDDYVCPFQPETTSETAETRETTESKETIDKTESKKTSDVTKTSSETKETTDLTEKDTSESEKTSSDTTKDTTEPTEDLGQSISTEKAASLFLVLVICLIF